MSQPHLTLEWDSSSLDAFRGRKVDAALQRALSKAGGDAIRAMRSMSGKSVRQRKRMKVKAVNEQLPITFPKTKQIEGLIWTMRVGARPVPVVDFPHRQNRAGVVVRINRSSNKLIKSAFVATMRSGHTLVGLRTGAKVGPKGGLNPFRELFTTRVSDVFADAGLIPLLQARAQVVFGQAFGRLLPLEIAKLTK